jgi:DNA-binding NtrC family response regulator
MLPHVHRTEATLAAGRRIEVRGGRLTVRTKDGEVSAVIGMEPVLVGRDPGCALVVPDRHVSAVHAELVATERGVRVRDLGSRNGTWIGDLAVVDAYLSSSARIAFGEVQARFDATAPEQVKVPTGDRFGALWGTSPTMRQLFAQLAKVAQTDLTVLVQGETGTGKELVARAIHDNGPRKDKPFVVVDCGAIAPSLAESLLFGHERGAFTGAMARRESPFVEAAGGTVFLDELGELPLEVQPRLLRALAEKRVQSVGGTSYRPFDARIVAATRRDLLAMVAEGAFRSDLYFRVAQVRAELPALRNRVEDIDGLVREMVAADGAPDAMPRVGRETMLRLMRHDWPGNVRELRNAVSVSVALAAADGEIDVAAYIGPPATFRAADPPVSVRGAHPDDAPTYHEGKRRALAQFERAYFTRLLQECEGSVVEVSRRSGLQRAHVRRYLRAHALVPRPRRGRPTRG